VKNYSLEKPNKKGLSRDFVTLSLVIAISLLFVYALKLLIDHSHNYYSQSNTHQTFKIDPELIEEMKVQSNDNVVLNSSSITGNIDSEIFNDALAIEPDKSAELTIPAASDAQVELAVNPASVNAAVITKETVDPEIVKSEKINLEIKAEQALSAAESWLLTQPKSNYSLQLASFKDPKLMDLFINQHADIKNIDYKKLESKNGWTYLLVGSFTSNQDAAKVKQAISFSKDIWIRKIGVLRANRCKNKGLSPDHPSC